jgi:hypothetical protein
MKFPNVSSHTVYKLDGENLVEWIQHAYGVEIDPIGEGEVPGDDSSGNLVVRIHQYDLKSNSNPGPGSVDQIIRALIENGYGEGEYHISFIWG